MFNTALNIIKNSTSLITQVGQAVTALTGTVKAGALIKKKSRSLINIKSGEYHEL